MDDRLRRHVPRQRDRDDANAGRTAPPAHAHSDEIRRMVRRENLIFQAKLLGLVALLVCCVALLTVMVLMLLQGVGA